MSLPNIDEDVVEDIRVLINGFCDFHEAYPNENQHIFRHVLDQVQQFDRTQMEYIQNEKSQEPIWKFERKNLTVYKRVFHPGKGEHITGADFVLYKKVSSPGKIGITAVQVKRNRGRRYFEFDDRAIIQFNKFIKSWKSAYYLFVDETFRPPLDCFLAVSELHALISPYTSTKSIKIPNADIRKYCRGAYSFYKLFYDCNRGSKQVLNNYLNLAISYVQNTKRVLIELFTDI